MFEPTRKFFLSRNLTQHDPIVTQMPNFRKSALSPKFCDEIRFC